MSTERIYRKDACIVLTRKGYPSVCLDKPLKFSRKNLQLLTLESPHHVNAPIKLTKANQKPTNKINTYEQ